MESLESIFKNSSSRLKTIFGVPDAPDPEFSLVTNLPDNIPGALLYKIGEDKAKIGISKQFYEEAKNTRLQELLWTVQEEVAHFYHHHINRPVWDEMGRIEHAQIAGTWTEDNRRILELKNLTEFVARLAGYYVGVPPQDGKELMNIWEKLKEGAKPYTKSVEEFDEYCVNNPSYSKLLYYGVNRILGCILGDRIALNTEEGFLPIPELVQGFAKANSFQEASDVYAKLYPDKENEVQTLTEQFFQAA